MNNGFDCMCCVNPYTRTYTPTTPLNISPLGMPEALPTGRRTKAGLWLCSLEVELFPAFQNTDFTHPTWKLQANAVCKDVLCKMRQKSPSRKTREIRLRPSEQLVLFFTIQQLATCYTNT